MGVKRPHQASADKPAKKQRGGFSVGPANLPDGSHRRKGAFRDGHQLSLQHVLQQTSVFQCTRNADLIKTVQKIKKDLIHKAKLKKQYAKLKAREDNEDAPRKSVYDREAETNPTSESTEPVPEPSLEPHPDRVRMLEEEEQAEENDKTGERRKRRSHPQPFLKEEEVARKKKKEAEARQRVKEEADKERSKKIAERERFRKTMAKARGSAGGQRKLGRESKVLLAKAQRLMSQT